MKITRPHRPYLASVFGCLCPRCREGRLFKNGLTWRLKRNLEMHEHCPLCGQPTDIEVGFYYGTGYVSYLLALGITGLSFLVWFLLIGFSFRDSRFAVWMTFNSLGLLSLQSWLMRFSRSLWLSFFISYDEDWENTKPLAPERLNEAEKNNW